MIYRFLYIVWRIFWSSVLVVLATLLLFAGVLFLALQTDPVKDYLTVRFENWFNETYEGELAIGQIGGVLPLHLELKSVTLEYEEETVAEFESLRISVDLIGLLRNHITINDIALDRPNIYLRRSGEAGDLTIKKAFQVRKERQSGTYDTGGSSIEAIDIFAPFVQVREGTLHFVDPPELPGFDMPAESVTLGDINTELFVELTMEQRYLDITYLTLQLREFDDLDFSLSGQIYNDSHYFEMNAMQMRLGDSHLDWNSEFTGIDFYAGGLGSQFRESYYQVVLQDAWLSPGLLSLVDIDRLSAFDGIELALEASGHRDQLSLSDVSISSGSNTVSFDAMLQNYLQRSTLTYSLDLQSFDFDKATLQLLVPGFGDVLSDEMASVGGTGWMQGTANALDLELEWALPSGLLTTQGNIGLDASFSSELTVQGERIDARQLFRGVPVSTRLNLDATLTFESLISDDFGMNLELLLEDSYIDTFHVPELQYKGELANRLLEHEFVYIRESSRLDGQGSVDFSGTDPAFVISGQSSDIDLQKVFQNGKLPQTELEMEYDINWHGLSPDSWHGRIVVDVMPSAINGNELNAHQLYLDLNHPEESRRSLRLTSSILDLFVEGQVAISSLYPLYEHWGGFFAHRVEEEYLFAETDTLTAAPNLMPDNGEFGRLDLEIVLEVKDLELLKAYLTGENTLESRAQLDVHLLADRERFDLSAQWRDPRTAWKDISITGSALDLRAGFRHSKRLRERQTIVMDMSADHLSYQHHRLDTLSWAIDISDDSLSSSSRIANFANEVLLEADVTARLAEKDLQASIDRLVVGNRRYLWNAENTPRLKYEKEGRLHVEGFHLVSGTDQIFVNGVFSNQEDDSVAYHFADVNLDRISRMIDGRVSFEGTLNADLVTRSLFQNPVLHGDLDASGLLFDGRVIGDITLRSEYNAGLNRFDTDLRVYTHPETYSGYLESNNQRGQDISARGWFKPPDAAQSADTLYYFDVDARQIDSWVLTYIMDSVFESIEGPGHGTGFISGNYDYIYFDGEFEVEDVVVEPVFFETEYVLNGTVSVNREDGVEIHRITGSDRNGGTGILTGRYDFNDFQAEKFMDLELRMDQFLFLNNSDGPEVPFYGSVAGTGVVTITGSNISPFVRTTEPIRTTSRSRLAIPLSEQGIGDERGRFIRFVKDFDDVDLRRHVLADPEVLRQIDRTFMEVFRMDLQFVAAPNSTVQLIFDPVTGEIVNARGEGRVRITLEDENLQIFGNFDVTDGDYLFVGGDILTRRFTLREGGSIRWEGDPANALLNITAVYRARPNIAPLVGGDATEQINRIPVELLLEITGPIDNIANDFYFEFPNAIDATQNAAVLNVLNSEEQKLIQATSLLFTGSFISGALVGDTQTQEFGSTLQARAGQVGISQLLSSQINALLSDNLVNLDVDLNLFGFDQADLGIALRLFDDRLVLRREGEVGGEETNIGDLGATYRINPNLSVEVFHRKDPMLMSILGTQAEVENVNGVGLEAQFRFNSWKEFGQRMWRNVTTVFGLLDRDDDEDEE
ncbi:translocation/assembly module TamB domain-containing protein [Balneolales bacterium ANBcel1]|nr:translocation/assembly module TamB domain-containing protein [Balneolales bacterium ANBcel1]